MPFDASSYGSVRFHARAETNTLTAIRVSLIDETDYFGKDLELETSWQEYVVPFAELRRPDGTGSIDPATLMGLEFFASSSEPFDFWVDDLAFGE